MKRFLQILKEEEDKALESKTSFGRNELKLVLAEAKLQAMIRYQEEKKIGAEVSP
jgi:hypothetical protein